VVCGVVVAPWCAVRAAAERQLTNAALKTVRIMCCTPYIRNG
jgi:hypothetical protein